MSCWNSLKHGSLSLWVPALLSVEHKHSRNTAFHFWRKGRRLNSKWYRLPLLYFSPSFVHSPQLCKYLSCPFWVQGLLLVFNWCSVGIVPSLDIYIFCICEERWTPHPQTPPLSCFPIHTSVDVYLGFLSVADSVAVNTGVHVSFPSILLMFINRPKSI